MSLLLVADILFLALGLNLNSSVIEKQAVSCVNVAGCSHYVSGFGPKSFNYQQVFLDSTATVHFARFEVRSCLLLSVDEHFRWNGKYRCNGNFKSEYSIVNTLTWHCYKEI